MTGAQKQITCQHGDIYRPCGIYTKLRVWCQKNKKDVEDVDCEHCKQWEAIK